MECSTECIMFEVPECSENLNINTLFEPNSEYFLHITNRDKKRIVKATTNDTGNIILSLIDNPNIPLGYFNRYAGFFEIKITKENKLCDYLPIELCDGSVSVCLFLIFNECTGEIPTIDIPCNCT